MDHVPQPCQHESAHLPLLRSQGHALGGLLLLVGLLIHAFSATGFAQQGVLPQNLPNDLDFELDFDLEEEAELEKPAAEALDTKLILAKSCNSFGLNFFRVLAENNRGSNLSFSPLNLSISFWMTYSGAKGLTEEEISKTLRLPISSVQVQKAYAEFGAALKQAAQQNPQQGRRQMPSRFKIANSFFITTQNPLFSDQFVALLKKNYQALTQKIPVRDARVVINNWINDQTGEQIPAFLERIDQNNAAKNINTVSFEGAWKHSFPRNQSRDLEFMAFNWRKVSTPFVQQTNNFRLISEENYQLITLEMKNSQLELQILLPSKNQSLAELEQALTFKQFLDWQTQLREQEEERVKLSLPKLELRTSIPVNRALVTLGIKSIFQRGKANLSGMGSAPGDIYFGEETRNQSTLKIQERGFSFAAATAVSFQPNEQAVQAQAQRNPRVFLANRPFLYWVVEPESNTLLLLGRYLRPQEQEGQE